MIVFEKISKKFGDLVVLDEIDINIPPNKITFVIGRSGEGKSVAIKHMIGLLKPDSGEIYVEGEKLSALDEDGLIEHRKKFGMLFQHAALFDSMDVLSNVSFPLIEQHNGISSKEINERAEACLASVGLTNVMKRFPSELSTGEQKRVGLARALVGNPKIILYDEPTTGMDPLISEMIDNLIVKINCDLPDVSSVVISHDIKATLATAEQIIMIYRGKVILEGDADTFLHTDNPIVRQFLSGKFDEGSDFFSSLIS